MSPQQQVWLITGCSTGFGFEISKQLLERGENVVATARKIDLIEPLKELGASVLQLDVTAGLDELKSKAMQAVSIYGRIDVFFANAGYVHYAPIEEADVEKDILKNMSTNTFGVVNMLRALMPHWRKQGTGFLLVNSSYMSWWSNTSGCGAYSASKAALDRLVSSFVDEVAMQQLNIKTFVVHPGHFRTDATKPTKFDFDRATTNYRELNEASRGFIEASHGKQPGDLSKGCKVLIDLVRGEGDVGGRELPSSLPLGSDAWETVVKETEKYLQILKDWEDVIRSTDVVPGSSAWAGQEK